MSYIPTVVFDFDGVIHSYVNGYKGEDVIPDPPVPGISDAIDQLRERGYRVVVVSTRCASAAGMGAVRRYLRDNEINVDDVMAEKPPAICYIDDRAICFRGDASALYEQVVNFKSWVSGQNDAPVSGLRPCKAAVYERGKFREVQGHFHRWGGDYEEFENGPGNYTTAIVELDNGMVVSCPAGTVKFFDRGEKLPEAEAEWLDGRCTRCAHEALDYYDDCEPCVEKTYLTPYCPACGAKMKNGRS